MRYLLFIFVMTAVLFEPNALPARAVTISPTIPVPNPSSDTGPAGFVANFYQFALMISGVLAFGAVVFGGVKYIAGAGNPSAQSEGKQWIESALLGLLLLAGAYIILHVVNPDLTNLDLINKLNLQQVNIKK